MGFWEGLGGMELADFRPGVKSRAELADKLTMACMEIGPGLADPGHSHPFEQCGVVIEGRIEMFIGQERRLLGPGDAYFVPAQVTHGWRTLDAPVRMLDVSSK